MKRYGLVLVLVILLLTSCAGTSTQSGSFRSTATQPPSSNLSGGYMHVYSNAVEFFQLTNTNGQMSGQEQEAYTTTYAPYTVKNGSSVVSGTYNGSHVTLTFSLFGFPVRSYAGTYDGTNLILTEPDLNGTLNNIQYDPASTQDYNNALSTFEANIQATVTAEQNAQATAAAISATATAVADQQSRLTYDLQNIGGAIQQLQSDSDFSTILKQYSNDINQMQQDYQTEQNDANGGCANAGQVGADDGTVGADFGTIGADDGSFQADLSPIQNDIANVNDFVQKIQQHWNNLGQQSPGVSQSDIDNAVNNGNNAIKQANANVSDAKSKASQYDNQANTIKQQADALNNGMHC